MKRISLVLTLLIIIAISFSFVFLRLQAHGAEDNYFNRNLRLQFARYPMVRDLLGLHFDGDGRADYLGPRYDSILIEVDVMSSVMAHLDSLRLLAGKIEAVTGKPTQYVISDRNIPYERQMDAAKFSRIVAEYRDRSSRGKEAVLYLFYATRESGHDNSLGITWQEDGVVLFADALAEFTANAQHTLVNYEASTALHEFGHQFGLPHNEEPGCLMNEHVEENAVAREQPEDVIIDFCEIEINQIRSTKSFFGFIN